MTGALDATPAEAGAPVRRPLPSGTVTFVFTDIEGSTRLLASLGDAYADVLDDHRRRIREAVEPTGGVEVGTEGDAVFLAFASPSAAVAAAAEAQRLLAQQAWPGGTGIPVRIGIHTGEATLAGDDYVGLEVHRAARIGSAAHGGQVILSAATRALVQDRLPAGVTLHDLGEHRLKDLSRPERLSQLVIEGLPRDFPPPRTLDTIPNNLPVQLTSFVGREEIVGETRTLLARTRLLTLTGPGGTGKTRLALQVAADVVDAYPDGVFFVPLAALSDPELIGPTIAAAANLPMVGSRPPLDQLIDALHGRRLLLVLDNFEQLLGAAPAIAMLLRGTGHLKLLVTSRSPLRISGEQELPVPPLGLPDPNAVHGAASLSQYDAVRLFIERAVAARPDFQVTNENAPAVAEITARLDGLPLAIELAAARLRVLSPQAILGRLGDRLSILSGGARDLPARQQTLRAAIAWSYDLLEPGDRDLFERLGVFRGGWSIEAAEAVCSAGAELAVDVFEGMGSLAEKSLIRPFEDEHGPGRFVMLETIHAYALERFEARTDGMDLRRAHAAWYTKLAADAAAEIGRGERRAALQRLEEDQGNVRAALEWLTTNDLVMAARLATDMWRFWQMRAYLMEGRGRIDAVFAEDDRRHVLEPGLRRELLSAAGGIAYWQGDFATTHVRYREAVQLAREHGTRHDLADALYDLSFAPRVPIDLETWQQSLAIESPPILDQAMAIYAELGDEAGRGKSLWARSEYDFFRGDFSRAVEDLTEAVRIFNRTNDRFQISWSLHSIGIAQTVRGELEAAREAITKAVRMFVEDGDLSGMTMALVDFAGLEFKAGNRDRAVRLAAAADASSRRTGTGLADASVAASYFPEIPRQPASGSPDRPAWDEGVAMSLDGAIVYALGGPLEGAAGEPKEGTR